jgi:hypothetical protein
MSLAASRDVTLCRPAAADGGVGAVGWRARPPGAVWDLPGRVGSNSAGPHLEEPVTVVTIELDGVGLGPLPVDVGPVRLPRGGGVLLDAAPWPDYLPSGHFPADGAAVRLAERGAARVLVACPPGVSPGCSALALAVGRLLVDLRSAACVGVRPAVFCAVRPRNAWVPGAVIVPHPVVVHAGAREQVRVIWEITQRGAVDGALVGAGPVSWSPIAAMA